jgi:DNA mismatch repair protein MutL
VPVRLLDDHVVNQIAAGEVVERPASVVKELVENALDAGARHVEVRLKAGGVAAIEVLDDGEGMTRADALMALERHATSKIARAEDLVGVASFGFRGEAIPSIASVCRLEIRTRRADEELGTRIKVEEGRLVDVSDAAGPVGTLVAARGLFERVPARRKFLRSRETETEHALEAIRRALLARPDVGVAVFVDGREALRAAPAPLARRVFDLLGEDARVTVPVQGVRGRVRVEGVMSPPGVHRAGATGSVYLYVQGRFVREGALRKAVADALRGALPPGRSPVLVLQVEVPGEDVDVNVHPQKTEVRFRDPRAVSEAVTEALRDALRGGVEGLVAQPGARPARAARPGGAEGGLFGAPAVAALPEDDPRFRPRPAPFAAPSAGGAEALVASTSDGAPGWARPPDAPMAPAPAQPTAEPATVEAGPLHGAPTPVAAPPSRAQGLARLRSCPVVGVHAGRYALLDDASTLIIVDLDAVRRADLAAILEAEAAAGTTPSRPLLVPATVTVGRASAWAAIAAAELLSSYGLEVAPFDPGVLAVTALPDRAPGDPEALLRAAISALEAAPRSPGLAAALASAATLEPVTVIGARSWLARIDEAPELAARAVGELSEPALARLVGQGRAP